MSTAAASPGFMCKLKDRKEIAEGTMAFHFERPPHWAFKAGQYLDMTLLNPSETDSEGNVRSFSRRHLDGSDANARYSVQARVEDDAVGNRCQDRRAVRRFDSSE